MADDRLSAELAAITERHDVMDWPPDDLVMMVSCLQASAADVPRLRAAVEAALKHHQPDSSAIPVCTCGLTWPCYEVASITRALLGEDGTDATQA